MSGNVPLTDQFTTTELPVEETVLVEPMVKFVGLADEDRAVIATFACSTKAVRSALTSPVVGSAFAEFSPGRAAKGIDIVFEAKL